MKMIQKVSIVFCDTESVELNIGKAEEMGIRILLEKQSSILFLIEPLIGFFKGATWICLSCCIDVSKLFYM